MSEQAGSVATEALIVSIAQRHLQARYQGVNVTRGDGNVVFAFTALEDQAAVAESVEKLCMAFTKELTGGATLRHQDFGELNFHMLRKESEKFDEYMRNASSAMWPDMSSLPQHSGVTKMLEVLYGDAVAEITDGCVSLEDFPVHLCPTGHRFDVCAAKTLLVSGFSSTSNSIIPQEDKVTESVSMVLDASANEDGAGVFELLGSGEKAKILVEARALAQLLAPFSTAPVEQSLPQQWRMRAFTLDESTEVLNFVYRKLIDYWQSNTHTEKTKVNAMSLLGIVSGDAKEYCKEQITLESSDLSGPWRMNRTILEKCLALCKQWQVQTKKLTGGDWIDWDSGDFKDDSFNNFVERVKSAVRIRKLMDNANTLLQRPELLVDVQPAYMFEGMSLIDSRHTPFDIWMSTVKRFEEKFHDLESGLIGRLRDTFANYKDEELIRVAKDFITLLRREKVRTALDDYLQRIHQFLNGKISSAVEKFNRHKNDSDVSAALRACRALQAELVPLLSDAKEVFYHTPHEKEIEEQVAAVIKEAATQEKALHERWVTDIDARAQAATQLERAVEIHFRAKTGIMQTKLEPTISDLIKESLNVLSTATKRISLSTTTKRTIDDCKRHVARYTKLQQICTMYNSILKQILPCTRDMLDPIAERCREVIFQQAGRSARAISFTHMTEIDSLVTTAHREIENFSIMNRKVRKMHVENINTVLQLYTVELHETTETWETKVADMRRSFDNFTLSNSKLGNSTEWRKHWDHQLYKALEHQYKKGLYFLNEKFEDKTDLIFKQGQVQFKPGLEILRTRYYERLCEYINFPHKLEGIQKTKFFTMMPSENAEGIAVVHRKAAELFNKVNKVRKQFREYVAVGICGTNDMPDLDLLVEKMVTTIEQWEAGFVQVKDKLRKTSHIDDRINVDCIEISTAPIRAAIEGQLNKLSDALMDSLRKAMQAKLSSIDDFVLFASNIIERQPTTLEEVGKANKAYHEFNDQLPKFEAEMASLEEMNKVLKNQHGAQFEMSLTKSRWDHLMDAMQSHHKIIEASVSKMRGSVDAMIQKFLKDISRFSNNWNMHKPQGMKAFKTRQDFIDKGLTYVKEQHLEFEDLEKAGKELEDKCDYFKIDPPDFSLVRETKQDIDMHKRMWQDYEQFEEALDVLRNEDWLTFRSHIYQFEDFIREWRDKIAAEKEEGGGTSETIVTKYLSGLLDSYNTALPMLKFVRGEGFLPEHWNEMFRLLTIDKSMTSDKLCFSHILEKHEQLLAEEKELKGLHSRAQGEVQIRDALQDLRTWAMEATFTLITPSDANVKVQLISEWKEVMTQVSDNQALVGSLKDSPFFPRFADEANGWETKLLSVSEYVVLLNNIQRKWAYLEPLFARGALPNEQPRFKRVDKEFVGILREIEADPRIMSLAQHSDYAEKLKAILDQIDRCQKALNEFLEVKRNKFPRFYFISDEDLLEILGQSKNPKVIQSHLKKLFMGINSVQFDESKTSITHMISSDGETVPLSANVAITDNNVEEWLIRLDETMRVTLKEQLKECCGTGSATNAAVIDRFPSQLLQVAEQIFFARDVEAAIPTGDYNGVLTKLRGKLDELTSLDSKGNNVAELKAKALILDIIHSIEVVELMQAKGVRQHVEWWWQKQLRYYLDDAEGCILRMVDTQFRYTFEYQGNAPKLVHTPLTDKCYLTLTKGMHLGYGGNPYGPAGTGKTESVKALGSAMGRQVLVFNCDEGIDFKAMGRIFIGIVKCGAWGCFDEFNRLKVDQLSAISQMIQVIQEALKNGEPGCSLLGRDIDVNPNSGIFVTLNPAGKGYGGRSKLPDNLKQLFRAVAMSAPDNELITATMLLSEGFRHARALSKKVVEVYKLSKQLLSQQQHYDWGLRPLKAVLRLGGTLVQQFRRENTGTQATEDQEAELMVQSLRINTLSKLTFDDARLFNGLIADIFPSVAIKEISYADLEVAIRSSIEELGLQVIESQIHKVLQLYEAMNQRMGVVLVGPSGSGKSTLLKILRKALQTLKVQVPWHVMNPKAMPRQQLLGHMDIDTREWFDGVLSAAARKVVKEPFEVRSWIFCDGDIDPEWVESLNSVLDDNKLLTMPNGVRIQFGNNINFVFETHSLEYASPATVSRMGIIFLSEEDVHLDAVVKSKFMHMDPARREVIQPWIDNFLYKAVELAEQSDALVVTTTRMGLLNAALTHVVDAVSSLDFATGLIRGLCSILRPEDQKSFARKIYELTNEKPVSSNDPLNTFFDRQKNAPAEFSAAKTNAISYNDLVAGNNNVPVLETERVMKVLEPLVTDSCQPVFVVGPTGCGKSQVLASCFDANKSIRVSVVHCSAQTTAQHIIQKIQQLCGAFSTNAGKVLRPKEGDRLVLVLKDLNLPKPDKYGTVQLHSFLQQLLLYQGFYDHELEWVGVEKVQIVGTMNPVASAGRFPVASRLLAIVNIISMSYPSKDSLLLIYSNMFNALLSSPQLSGTGFSDGLQLATFCTTVFDKVKRRFEGEEYAHCVFCPRDITQWVMSVQRYSLEATSLPQILLNEGLRIFSDRLSRPEDRSRCERILNEAVATIGFSPNKDDRSQFVSWNGEWNAAGKRELALTEHDRLKKDVKEAMVKYSREFKDLNISLIPETLGWITRVDRAISQPVGHVLLVGSAGVGRRATIAIASYLLRIEVVALNMSRDYGMKQFRADLRNVITRAGVANEKITLVVEDHNIITESFLEMINSLISSGEIPGLFTPEELDPLLGPLREEAGAEGFLGTMYQYFLRRINSNLRVCLIMDNKNERFGSRCQSNPALLTRCTLLWMGTWSNDGSKMMCKSQLRDLISELEKNPEQRDFRLASEMLALHQSVGEKGTPQLFQTLMNSFQSIYNSKGKSSTDSLVRLEAGLEKLREAENQVASIEREVSEKKVQMEEKQREADEAMTQITNNMADAAEQRTAAEELTQKLDVEQKEITVKAAKVGEELSTIQPTLDAAKEAVGGIKQENLSEIKNLKSPPEPIRDVLEGVLGLLGQTDTSWSSMRKFLGERGVVNRILAFDTKDVTPQIREQVNKLLNQKANSFKPEVISRASSAAAPLAAWVKANVSYATVLERVGPLQKQLDDLETNKAKGEEKLHKTQKKLKKIDENVEKLRKDFAAMCKEAERLKDRLEKAEQQLQAAHELLEKLSGEKIRWSEDAAAIREQNKLMPKKALLAAAFITYLAKEPEDVRAQFMKQWSDKLGFPTTQSITSFMRQESTLLQYKAEGLPSDGLSQENSVVILDSVQTPLIIDPANQAIQWLKTHLKNKEATVEVASMADERFAHTLELAIRFGKTLLVTEIDRVDPMLFPVLRKDLVSQGPKKVVQLGPKSVDWQENFKIFLVTRSTDLVLSPDSTAMLAEVNFSITRSGLESQLLGLTIQHEQPELEKQKVELLEQEESLKMQLAQLEESLLSDLANSHGNIVENVGLINSLNQIKTQASTIHASLAQSKSLTEEIDQKREVYRPFANKGSVMFFLIKDMEALNRMYQFSLADFLSIFQGALSTYQGDPNLEVKIPTLSLMMAQQSFLHVSRGLFKEDRIEFAIHVAHGFFPDQFPEHLWGALIGLTSADAETAQLPSWAVVTAKAPLAAIQAADPQLVANWNLNDPSWEAWSREEKPEATLEQRQMSIIERLLLVSTFRRDRLLAAMTQVVLQLLQLPAIVSVTTIDSLAAESSCQTPILLITSAGADPSLEVQEVAYKTVGRNNFTQIALGGGQTDEAMNQLRRCAIDGEWLFLKNLHLVLDWVSVLEKEVASMPKPHDNFRLFMTTESHDQFPSVLLKSSLKMTFQAPPGVKANMMRSFGNWTPEFMSQLPPMQAQLLFGLGWFHAILQERRTFIPQGWVKFYEFTQADQKSASDVILAMSQTGNVDWTTVRGMLESAVYGGRLDNDQDVKVLQAFIKKIFNPETLINCSTPLYESLAVPRTNDHGALVQCVSTVPDVDAPGIFSLPPNADRVVSETDANRQLGELKRLAHLSVSSGSSSDALRSMLPTVLETWKTAEVVVHQKPPVLGAAPNPDPLENFFVSEITLLARLMNNLATFFDEMKAVSDGVMLPSATFRGLANTLIQGSVPEAWQDRMDGPDATVAWLAVLNRRYNAMLKLYQQYQQSPESVLQAKIRLPDMLRPHTFLNALRQFTARRTGDALVTLVLGAFIGGSNAGQVSAVLDGSTILMQGALPSGNGLQLVSNNHPSASPISDVTIGWIKAERLTSTGFVRIPVYSTSSRELHIFDLQMPCPEEEKDKWVMAGAGCFLSQ